MSLWDKKFLSRCKKLGIKIELYKRYVDDTFIVLRELNKGWRYCPRLKKMTFHPELSDETLSGDQLTFLALTGIANDIDDDIQMESDVPSQHQDGYLPVLDLKVKVVNNKVEYLFYSKPCSSPYTIMYASALSSKQKRETILQEGLR